MYSYKSRRRYDLFFLRCVIISLRVSIMRKKNIGAKTVRSDVLKLRRGWTCRDVLYSDSLFLVYLFIYYFIIIVILCAD